MNPFQLVELLEGHKTYIQTHNFPDPDAIASAFGLRCFLKHHGIETEICYDGRIEKLSTRKMITVFDIDICSREEIEDTMREEDYIILVDSQKYNANITDFIGDEVACIDHHPTMVECEYAYRDVRLVGSCSAIIAEYFKQTDTPMDSTLAAALAYGIKMDTADFIRGATELDVNMFAYVYPMLDVQKLNIMYTNVMEFSDLKAYGAAIDSIQVYHNVGFAAIPFDCPDALIAIISDFILSLDVVDISVIYAIRSDGIKFSMRSALPEVDAGLVISRALTGYGSGGGHPSMAGGFIPKENMERIAKDRDYKIRKLFLQQLHLA